MKKQGVMLYIIKKDKILFLVRNKKNDQVHEQGKLVSIGGKVENGESILNAMQREAKEEANISVKSVQLRAIMYFTNFGIQKNDWIDYLFVTDSYEGNLTNGNEGTFIWKSFTNIKSLNLYQTDKIYLTLLKKHQFFSAEFICERHKLIEYRLLNAL